MQYAKSSLWVLFCAIGLVLPFVSAAAEHGAVEHPQATFETVVLQAERSLFRVGADSGGAATTGFYGDKLADCIPYTACFSTVGILACLSLPTESCCPWRYCVDFGDIPEV